MKITNSNTDKADPGSYNHNPTLAKLVGKDTKLKRWLVNYVGKEKDPESDEVTVGMIVEVIAKEFPDFLMVVAEENYLRGYEQALADVEEGEKIYKSKVSQGKK